MTLLAVLPFAHALLRKAVQPGDHVIDGTCGNGNDTLLLAKLVGSSGKVFAFDIQAQAIAATKKRLAQQLPGAAVELIHDSHAVVRTYIDEPVRAAIFNLGYLPGGDKQITTEAASTIASIKQILELLEPAGLLLLVVYHGHPEGKTERQALDQFVSQLPQESFHVLQYRFTNQRNDPPYLIAIEKRN